MLTLGMLLVAFGGCLSVGSFICLQFGERERSMLLSGISIALFVTSLVLCLSSGGV
jgi:hypothetical protein